ncbi:MAG: ribonuclease HII [Dehalococcoidia bacterium]|nr:ribonuclease HII [Dehalococcoidia bacterium]
MEKHLAMKGYHFIAGIDEVGRGALAGPVAAAAVILPENLETAWIHQVRDSKLLSARQRSRLSGYIKESALSFGVGVVSHEYIDANGIIKATRMAMQEAVQNLDPQPDHLIIDALKLPSVKLPQESIIHGDRLCLSISCASILAKVARDLLMAGLDGEYPGYGFASNKGYGTGMHLENLRRLGPCPIHRRSFAPLKKNQLAMEL